MYMSCTSCDFLHVQNNCTCYNLNNAKIQVIACTKLGHTCYNMYKILFKNGFNLLVQYMKINLNLK
jgi:hypothetical protein